MSERKSKRQDILTKVTEVIGREGPALFEFIPNMPLLRIVKEYSASCRYCDTEDRWHLGSCCPKCCKDMRLVCHECLVPKSHAVLCNCSEGQKITFLLCGNCVGKSIDHWKYVYCESCDVWIPESAWNDCHGCFKCAPKGYVPCPCRGCSAARDRM